MEEEESNRNQRTENRGGTPYIYTPYSDREIPSSTVHTERLTPDEIRERYGGQGILVQVEAAGNTVTIPSTLTEAEIQDTLRSLSRLPADNPERDVMPLQDEMNDLQYRNQVAIVRDHRQYPLTPEQAFEKEEGDKILYGTPGNPSFSQRNGYEPKEPTLKGFLQNIKVV